jgi:outer membrane protein assembly factor BamA
MRLTEASLAGLFLVASASLLAQEASPSAGGTGGLNLQFTPADPSQTYGPLPLNPAAIAPPPSVLGPPKPVPPEQKRGAEFLAAPIPISNPTLGSGLAVVAALIFPLSQQDKVSPPTVAGVGGFYTSNHSYAAALAIRPYLAEDRWRLLGFVGLGSINYNFFGIGGASSVSVPIDQKFSGFDFEGLRRVSTGFYLGARYFLAHSTLSLGQISEGAEPPPVKDLSVQTAALGLVAQTDSRDSTFYPTKGSYFNLKADFYDPAFASDRTFQRYQADYNKYLPIGERQVLAVRASGCDVAGDAPIYALCLFGSDNDLRGYEVGRYLDRSMLAAQGEYRLMLPERLGFFGRFGFVAFAGVGEVADSFSDFDSDKLLPAGGIGIRFLLARENRVNFRIDYAWGKSGNRGLYVGVGEAF